MEFCLESTCTNHVKATTNYQLSINASNTKLTLLHSFTNNLLNWTGESEATSKRKQAYDSQWLSSSYRGASVEWVRNCRLLPRSLLLRCARPRRRDFRSLWKYTKNHVHNGNNVNGRLNTPECINSSFVNRWLLLGNCPTTRLGGIPHDYLYEFVVNNPISKLLEYITQLNHNLIFETNGTSILRNIPPPHPPFNSLYLLFTKIRQVLSPFLAIRVFVQHIVTVSNSTKSNNLYIQ